MTVNNLALKLCVLSTIPVFPPNMLAYWLLWWEILVGFYLIMALSIFLWSLSSTSQKLPLEAQSSCSETLIASILWPITMWVCITSLAKSLDEEDSQ